MEKEFNRRLFFEDNVKRATDKWEREEEKEEEAAALYG